MSVENRVEALESLVATLEARLRELEDVREVTEVQRRWNHMCSGGFNGINPLRTDEALDLVSEDATIEFSDVHDKGKGPKGVSELRTFWDSFHKAPYVFQTSSDIGTEVRGDAARQRSGTFKLIQTPWTKNAPFIAAMRFQTEFTRTPNGWKISSLRHTPALRVPLDNAIEASAFRPHSGWTKDDA